MRFLFTSIPGYGHFYPVVPLAKALEAAGHSVAVVTAPAFSDAVTGAGLEVIPAGLDWSEVWLLDTLPELIKVREEQHGGWLMNRIFLDRSPRAMIPALMDIIPEWKPDVVLSGTFEFGGAIAAEKSGVPYASCSISIRWSRWVLRHMVGRAIAGLRKDYGLAPDPALSAFGRHLDLCFVPRSWDLTAALLDPALGRLVRSKLFWSDLPLRQRGFGAKGLALQTVFALHQRLQPSQAESGATTHFIGSRTEERVDVARPALLDGMPDRPTVFVSLGTVFASQYPEVFEIILNGLRDEPINLVMTMGGSANPDWFGPQPDNVRLVRFLSQAEMMALLPHVDLSINHGGFGTVMDALSHGIPQIQLPLSADQPVIARLCLANGVAPALPASLWRLSGEGLPIVRLDRLTPEMIRDAVREGLGDPCYRAAAQRIRAEQAALPGREHAVELLERLAAGAAPVAAKAVAAAI